MTDEVVALLLAGDAAGAEGRVRADGSGEELAVLLALIGRAGEARGLAGGAFDGWLAADALRAGGVPEVPLPSPELAARLEARAALAQGKPRRAGRLLESLEKAALADGAARRYVIDGADVESLRDLDDLLGPTLELFHDGRWLWLEFSRLRSLNADPDAGDWLTRLFVPVEAVLETGERLGDAAIPALYAGTLARKRVDAECRLGLATACVERGGLVLGLGQRVWLADGHELTVDGWETLEAAHGRIRLL